MLDSSKQQATRPASRLRSTPFRNSALRTAIVLSQLGHRAALHSTTARQTTLPIVSGGMAASFVAILPWLDCNVLYATPPTLLQMLLEFRHQLFQPIQNLLQLKLVFRHQLFYNLKIQSSVDNSVASGFPDAMEPTLYPTFFQGIITGHQIQ